jgi:hypothetical protein
MAMTICRIAARRKKVVPRPLIGASRLVITDEAIERPHDASQFVGPVGSVGRRRSSGSGTTTGKGTGTIEIEIVFTEGTGFFAGATGEVTVTGTELSTGPTTGEITGSYVGTLSIVPEPGGPAVLTPAVAVGAVVLVRARRNKPTTL